MRLRVTYFKCDGMWIAVGVGFAAWTVVFEMVCNVNMTRSEMLCCAEWCMHVGCAVGYKI